MAAIEIGSECSQYEEIIPRIRIYDSSAYKRLRTVRSRDLLSWNRNQGGWLRPWGLEAPGGIGVAFHGHRQPTGVVLQGISIRTLRLLGGRKSAGVDPRINDIARRLYAGHPPARHALVPLDEGRGRGGNL